MKTNDPYVVKCIKNTAERFGLGFRYKKGQYVTCSGKPTNDINQAAIYRHNHKDPLMECGLLDLDNDWQEYFELVPVECSSIRKVKIDDGEAQNSVLTMQLPFILRAEDYHQFGPMQDFLRHFLSGVKVFEITKDEDDYYYAVVYRGKKPTKSQIEELHKTKLVYDAP